MRRHLPRIYGLRQAAAQTRNGSIRRTHRQKGTTDHRTPTPGARNDSATRNPRHSRCQQHAAEKRHGVAL